jgi:DNA-directed RNA polymerase sigma subunit (sigma70/sigma32)
MAIGREIVNTGHPIRLPVHVAQRLAELRRATDELELATAGAPSADELARTLGWSSSEVDELRSLPADPGSLDGGLAEWTDADAVATGAGTGDPLDVISDDAVATAVDRMVDLLAEPERTVLVLRYGLHGAEPCSWDQLADRLQLSRGELRRIERRAITGLRRRGQDELAELAC